MNENQMSLKEVVERNPRDYHCTYGYKGLTQVYLCRSGEFPSDFWHLSDYAVTGRASGPSLVLVPRRIPGASPALPRQ